MGNGTEFVYHIQYLEKAPRAEASDLKQRIIHLLLKEYIAHPDRPGK